MARSGKVLSVGLGGGVSRTARKLRGRKLVRCLRCGRLVSVDWARFVVYDWGEVVCFGWFCRRCFRYVEKVESL
jgi:hypothetical protein